MAAQESPTAPAAQPPEPTISETLERLHAIGWTQAPQPLVVFTDELKTPAFLSSPNENAEKHLLTGDVRGHAMDPDRDLARLKAVAECVERLNLRNPSEQDLIDDDRPAHDRCDPALFRPYSADQLTSLEGYLDDVRQGPYRWWTAKDWGTGKLVEVPAQMLFLSGLPEDEPQIRGERISTGAALGVSGSERAFASGLFEAVERDATVSAYLTRREIRRVVGLPAHLLRIVDYFHRYRLEPYIFDLTSDLGIPTIMVVTLDRTGLGPGVHAGSSAARTYGQAIEKALYESVQSRAALRLARALEPTDEVAENEVTSLEARYRFWWSPDRIADLDFWLESDRTVRYEELASTEISIEQAAESITSKGYHLFVADITRPEVREQGFEVLKVVVPEFHPLYLNERNKYLYSGRHGEIANDRSLKPHPFT